MQTASSWNPAPTQGERPSDGHTSGSKLAAVAAVAALGALVAVFADAAPTSWPLVDAAYRAALVVACALAGSRARRWSLVWAAVVATLAGGGWFHLAAIAALAGAVAMYVLRFRDRVLGATVGAAIGLAVLHLARPGINGGTAAAAAVAVVPLLASGYRRSRRRTRRVVVGGIVVAVATCIAALAGAAAFGLDQRAAITAAVDETSRAVDALAADETDVAQQGFASAAAQFAAIRDSADAPWLIPARLVPVVGSNLRMVRTAAGVGAELNQVADELSTSIDQEALRGPTGGVDVAVLREMAEPVQRAARQIDSARAAVEDVRSAWLLGPVQEGVDELVRELDRAGGSATTAAMAVERGPALLGADGPRRYLMLLGNPAETRDIGGHIGNWVEVAVEDGNFSLTEIGSPYELSSPTREPQLEMTPGAYPQTLVELRPQMHAQNWGGTPDLPTVARLAADLYPQARPGRTLDGVIYADPFAFAALLEFTGPVEVPSIGLTLTPENAVRFLTADQFSAFGTEQEGNAATNDLIEEVVDRFSSGQLPSPRRLVEVLGPLVERGRLQFASLHEEDNPLLDRLGLLGRVERPGAGDLLGVFTRNTNPSKIDVYLHKSVRYLVDWDPDTGSAHARLVVTLSNEAPAEGVPTVVANPIPGLAPGTNRTTLSILSPSSVRSVTVDREPVGVGTQQDLRGVHRHNVLVEIPPGEERVVEFELQGLLGARVPYVLQWVGQPSVNPGEAVVEVRSTGSRRDTEPTSRRFELLGDEDSLLSEAFPWS